MEVNPEEMEIHIEAAMKSAQDAGVFGKELTPYLLKYISEHTQGESLAANIALIKNNAAFGAKLAIEFQRLRS